MLLNSSEKLEAKLISTRLMVAKHEMNKIKQELFVWTYLDQPHFPMVFHLRGTLISLSDVDPNLCTITVFNEAGKSNEHGVHHSLGHSQYYLFS